MLKFPLKPNIFIYSSWSPVKVSPVEIDLQLLSFCEDFWNGLLPEVPEFQDPPEKQAECSRFLLNVFPSWKNVQSSWVSERVPVMENHLEFPQKVSGAYSSWVL